MKGQAIKAKGDELIEKFFNTGLYSSIINSTRLGMEACDLISETFLSAG